MLLALTSALQEQQAQKRHLTPVGACEVHTSAHYTCAFLLAVLAQQVLSLLLVSNHLCYVQLHRDMLLNKLLALNISSKRARQIVDTDSSGWRLEMLVGANKMLDLTFQVFRPNSAVPVITAPFEEVYSRVALLWKQEFDSPKPKSVPRSSHHTRQQERNAAAMEERMQSEGLSPIQLHQVQSVVAAVVTKQQQQTQSDMQGMRNIQTTMAAAIENQNKLFEQQMSFFQQFVPALHYSTAASAQLAYPSHAMANMPAAQQQDARQPSQNLPSDAAPFAAQSAV